MCRATIMANGVRLVEADEPDTREAYKENVQMHMELWWPGTGLLLNQILSFKEMRSTLSVGVRSTASLWF